MRIFYHFKNFTQYLRLIRTFKLYYVLVVFVLKGITLLTSSEQRLLPQWWLLI